MPVAWFTLTGGREALPGRRGLERKRQAKAEGKIKGRGTGARRKAVCTWGWRGTRSERCSAASYDQATAMLHFSRASFVATRRARPESWS